jgi:hypothetical protein
MNIFRQAMMIFHILTYSSFIIIFIHNLSYSIVAVSLNAYKNLMEYVVKKAKLLML